MKVHFLDLGRIEYDLGWALLGAGVSTPSDPNPTSPRRNVAVIATLIDHPSAGPVLFDTGIAPAYQELWPAQIQQAFAVTRFEDENRLEGALGAAGYALHDVRAVVLSHLHLDHAGGLEAFRGTNVPIYVHADELRNAFYAVATGEDLGAYLPHYVDASFNWQPLHQDTVELFSGCTLHLLPGHTYALYGLRLDLANAGTFFLTSDQFHLRDNWEGPQPLGWLLRDHAAWWRSYRFTKALVDQTSARLVFGHDAEVLTDLRREPCYD